MSLGRCIFCAARTKGVSGRLLLQNGITSVAEEAIRDYVVTVHAARQMRRRGIGEEVLQRVLRAPEERRRLREGRDVLQSRIEMAGKTYLVRVFVDTHRQPPEVVTIYRTSRINRYWRQG
jgi:GNAT superfamily N-acetyltransferase